MVDLLDSFDPSVSVIQRTRTRTTSQTPAPSSRRRRSTQGKVEVHAPSLPTDIVQWEVSPLYELDKDAAFAAQVAQWMESYCYIRIKNGPLVKFRLNAIQEVLMQFVAWRWSQGLAAKAITPKARQLGSSTFWECLLYALCENVPGFQAAIVAHDETGVGQLWGKIKTIKNNLAKTSYGDSHLVNDSEGAIKWITESYLFTGLIRSADALGKAGSPNGVHFSEVANFSDKGCNAEEGIASILSAMSETRWTVEIYESTAKGKDKVFYGRCEDAKNPDSNSDLTLIFLPWFLEPGYSLTWKKYRQRLVASGKKDPGPTFKPNEEERILRRRLSTAKVAPSERTWRYRVDLSDEQLIYYRWLLANKCKNKSDVRKRYYPSFYEECFTASQDAAFSDETIEYYRALAKPPLITGKLLSPGKSKACSILADPGGPVSIWQYPQPHQPYLIGGDPGGSKADSDPYHAWVMNKITREIVASVHGHMEWDDFARLLVDLGYCYNTAHLIVENNYNPAIANTIHSWGYPNLYYYFAEQRIEAAVGPTPGFSNNKKTRKEAVALLRAYMRVDSEHNQPTPLIICYDVEICDEMENFVWVPYVSAQNPDMDGDYKAIGGNHDDRLLALAIMLPSLSALIPDAALEPTPEPPTEPEPPNPLYEWYLARQAKTKTKERVCRL